MVNDRLGAGAGGRKGLETQLLLAGVVEWSRGMCVGRQA